jgi:hypothetical protein
MLADGDAQLGAEQESGGRPSIWRAVYAVMQCPGAHATCWCDPLGKKHYKLSTHHLKALIDFVEQGNQLYSHDDVPDQICEQLIVKEQQRAERQS